MCGLTGDCLHSPTTLDDDEPVYQRQARREVVQRRFVILGQLEEVRVLCSRLNSE